ncbi:MAG TPA: hypothetical protein VGP99_08670 [Tepidisphaeraceae bacterium]|jgi:hypothetical protein|nr:hypothetical protein [Tepidisphaeraceae bacterium]
MLQRLISIVVVACLASVVLGQEKSKEASERELQRKKWNDAAKAALQRHIPQVNLVNVGFRDAIDFLRDVSGANVYVNWREIKKAGVDEQTQLNLKVKDVTFEKVLNLVLSEVSGKDPNLAWVLDDGVIEISTADQLRGIMYIRVYEVGDLLDARVEQRKGEVLVSIISECIAPSSWADAGGKAAIKFRDGKLVITQTAENHQAIMNLLDGLREFRK